MRRSLTAAVFGLSCTAIVALPAVTVATLAVPQAAMAKDDHKPGKAEKAERKRLKEVRKAHKKAAKEARKDVHRADDDHRDGSRDGGRDDLARALGAAVAGAVAARLAEQAAPGTWTVNAAPEAGIAVQPSLPLPSPATAVGGDLRNTYRVALLERDAAEARHDDALRAVRGVLRRAAPSRSEGEIAAAASDLLAGYDSRPDGPERILLSLSPQAGAADLTALRDALSAAVSAGDLLRQRQAELDAAGGAAARALDLPADAPEWAGLTQALGLDGMRAAAAERRATANVVAAAQPVAPAAPRAAAPDPGAAGQPEPIIEVPSRASSPYWTPPAQGLAPESSGGVRVID